MNFLRDGQIRKSIHRRYWSWPAPFIAAVMPLVPLASWRPGIVEPRIGRLFQAFTHGQFIANTHRHVLYFLLRCTSELNSPMAGIIQWVWFACPNDLHGYLLSSSNRVNVLCRGNGWPSFCILQIFCPTMVNKIRIHQLSGLVSYQIKGTLFCQSLFDQWNLLPAIFHGFVKLLICSSTSSFDCGNGRDLYKCCCTLPHISCSLHHVAFETPFA